MRKDPRYARKKKKTSGATSPVAGLEIAQAQAEAARLPDDALQQLLDQHRAGDDVRAKLMSALTYLCYAACDDLSHIGEHLLALDTCLDRLLANTTPAEDLPRYIQNEMMSHRKEARTEHRTRVSSRSRDDLEDTEASGWNCIDLDEERLDEQALEVAKLLREGRTFAEICEMMEFTQHHLYKIIDTLKRAAA